MTEAAEVNSAANPNQKLERLRKKGNVPLRIQEHDFFSYSSVFVFDDFCSSGEIESPFISLIVEIQAHIRKIFYMSFSNAVRLRASFIQKYCF
mmetsp:Transcript_19481/g.31899  ORF Transcript_19481/g.31899 Transcript_19481/m.31899 type:complete len:93 (+) Transcript_19481:1338-1616(+)